MNAIVRNTTTVPARVAAPPPMGEKTTLATITAGPAAVVQPGLARRERPEVRDVVVRRAERSPLGDVARDPPTSNVTNATRPQSPAARRASTLSVGGFSRSIVRDCCEGERYAAARRIGLRRERTSTLHLSVEK
jgi:hypothetical protein